MLQLNKYSAVWCQPCRTLSANLDQIDLNAANISLNEFDVDLLERSALKDLSIRGVPTLILIRDGVEIGRKTGALTHDELRKFLMIGE